MSVWRVSYPFPVCRKLPLTDPHYYLFSIYENFFSPWRMHFKFCTTSGLDVAPLFDQTMKLTSGFYETVQILVR
jgi:hypothetical protein